MSDAAFLMDRMYRYQRYIYDFTRRPYLLGRDRVISDINVRGEMAVLEIGCGTGRNLVKVADAYPKARCYGIDISSEMLQTAHEKVKGSGLSDRVKLAQADATDFAPQTLFGRTTFNRIFISYSLSMIPQWRAVLAHAVAHLAEGGELHIVDFGEQGGLPRWFRAALRTWLGWFAVHPRAELPAEAAALARQSGLTFAQKHYFGGYATHIILRK